MTSIVEDVVRSFGSDQDHRRKNWKRNSSEEFVTLFDSNLYVNTISSHFITNNNLNINNI